MKVIELVKRAKCVGNAPGKDNVNMALIVRIRGEIDEDTVKWTEIKSPFSKYSCSPFIMSQAKQAIANKLKDIAHKEMMRAAEREREHRRAPNVQHDEVGLVNEGQGDGNDADLWRERDLEANRAYERGTNSGNAGTATNTVSEFSLLS